MDAPAPDLGFIHQFVPASAPRRQPLLLLHGTGGDENDLLPLGRMIAPGAALLSPRGKVLENGMPRFFRRHAEGVFDIDDLKARALELADFVERARAHYGVAKPLAVGFSNGANVAAAILLLRGDVFAGAILIRALLPLEPESMPSLSGVPVLVLSGAEDPLIPAAGRERLAQVLREAGADVSLHILPAGHGLTQADVAIATEWVAKRG
jgi:phospholipase/carboxylesterase